MSILKIKDKNGNIIEIPAIKGDKGDSPIEGVDYWTQTDKAEIMVEHYSFTQRLTK